MSAITPTDLDAAYKVLYAGQKISNLVFDKFARPFLSRLKRKEDFEGDYYPVPVMYEDVGGGSNTFSKAQENVAAMALATFQADVADYHRVVQIKAKALRKARSNLGSFLSQQQVKTDSMLNALSNDIEKGLFRNASGYRGIIGTISSGTPNTIVLATTADAKLFSLNDQLICATNTTSAPEAAVGTITAIDRGTGTLTVTGTLTNWDAGDYLWREGDYVSASDTKSLHGLADWIPTSLEAGTFMGVTRSADRERLAGLYDSTGSLTDIEFSILNVLATMGDRMASPVNTLLMDYTLWGLLAKEKGVEVSRDPRDGKAGFTSIAIAHPNGIAECVPATFCQANTVWGLVMEDWLLLSAGEAVGIFDDDGNLILRKSDDDALEVRGVSYPELVCFKPARQFRLAFS